MGFKLKNNIVRKWAAGLLAAAALTSATAGGALAYDAGYLMPMGNAVGINVRSEGVMVVGVPELLGDGASKSPAKSAGIAAGDIITRIGERTVSSNEELKAALDGLDGSPVELSVIRGDSVLQVRLTPHKAEDGRCELGLWMRDVIAGIGTLTFYDPETGVFGALGHSVNDLDTGIIIPLRTGTVTHSVVTDVVPGKAGFPGQLHGSFNADVVLGSLTKNASSGIFGQMAANDLTKGKKLLPVAGEKELKTGPAVILSNVSGSEVREYAVQITRIYTGDEAIGRSMMITVTDPKLIEQTGGIVQGMSGSPIIQNGKLVGAVTHVLINDPTRGYGISIKKMLDTVPEPASLKPDKAA